MTFHSDFSKILYTVSKKLPGMVERFVQNALFSENIDIAL